MVTTQTPYRVIPVTGIAPGMVIGGFAPGGRIPGNLLSAQCVRSVSMRPAYGARGRYAGQVVTVAYFSGRVSSFAGTETVCLVSGS
jgi:hypothetical protein